MIIWIQEELTGFEEKVTCTLVAKQKWSWVILKVLYQCVCVCVWKLSVLDYFICVIIFFDF